MEKQEEKAASDEGDTNANIMCGVCRGTPCDWLSYGNYIISETELTYAEDPQKGMGEVENRFKRKVAYRYYVLEKYDFFRKANKILIPYCILDGVREKWPEADGNYMGYKSL